MLNPDHLSGMGHAGLTWAQPAAGHLRELQAMGTRRCTSQPKCTVFWPCILSAKLLLVGSGHHPGTFPSCLRVLGASLKPWSRLCSAAPGRPGQEGDGCPVPLQPSMPAQTGDTAVSTSASVLVGRTHAAAVRVTTSTRTRGAALVGAPLLPCPFFICSSLSLFFSCLSLSAHPSPSLTSDRLLQLRKPQLPARVREHPHRALLPLPQRVHAAA